MYICVIAENMINSYSGIQFKEFIKQAAYVRSNTPKAVLDCIFLYTFLC